MWRLCLIHCFPRYPVKKKTILLARNNRMSDRTLRIIAASRCACETPISDICAMWQARQPHILKGLSWDVILLLKV